MNLPRYNWLLVARCCKPILWVLIVVIIIGLLTINPDVRPVVSTTSKVTVPDAERFREHDEKMDRIAEEMNMMQPVKYEAWRVREIELHLDGGFGGA